MSLIRSESGGIVTLRLNRPQQRNALSEELIDALQADLDALARDGAVRCVVIAGAGDGFCAGHDLAEIRRNRRHEYYLALFSKCGRMMQSIRDLPVPVIASVAGIATAAGCQLVAACDLAIAADTARFAVSGINVGLFCTTPGVALSRNLSTKRAFEMLVGGRFIDAATAAQYGLINEVAPAGKLEETVAQRAADIAAKSPAAIRFGKAAFYRQAEMTLAEAYRYASEIMAQNLMHEDANEGIEAFFGKRVPVWPSGDAS
jgi:enoyl-CoA hydratase/carnithine racemase